MFICFLDLSYLEDVRAQIPVQQQKRSDMYKLEMLSWNVHGHGQWLKNI